jgi:hypothetical protein
MKAFARIERLERLLRRPVRGIKYQMPDRSWRILPHNHIGFSDALDRIDSPSARIVLSATTDSRENNGAMLKLLFAVMHPIDTTDSPTQSEETIQHENDVIMTAS